MAREESQAEVVICGAGIVGLVLALALKEHVGIQADLYETVPAFHEDVGAGMGMYPNGLRVIRDISPSLFDAIRDAGHPYVLRRFERHDGTEVAVSEECVLCEDDEDLKSIGIRRWRLQRVLYEAVLDAGIKIHFGKRLSNVVKRDDGLVELSFDDGTKRVTAILFGADGTRSNVREILTGSKCALTYTGVTCIMGMADLAREDPGICFPSSLTSKCHACYFPTRQEEQCFQIHFPIPAEDADDGNWGMLSDLVAKEECCKLAERLEEDGWDEKYTNPLKGVTRAVRIGFCKLEPKLDHWVFGNRIVLVGDAAHPPVPFTGQGAQMGLEDAGTIALLMKRLCLDDDGTFQQAKFGRAMMIYEKMRIPRTKEINDISQSWGSVQQKRAHSPQYNVVKEEKIRRDVFFHLTLPAMLPGVTYDYKADVDQVLQNDQAHHLPILVEVPSMNSGDEQEAN